MIDDECVPMSSMPKTVIVIGIAVAASLILNVAKPEDAWGVPVMVVGLVGGFSAAFVRIANVMVFACPRVLNTRSTRLAAQTIRRHSFMSRSLAQYGRRSKRPADNMPRRVIGSAEEVSLGARLSLLLRRLNSTRA